MRIVWLCVAVFALVPVVPGAAGAGSDAGPLMVTYSLLRGSSGMTPPNPDWLVVDTCTTAVPVTSDCTGVLGRHGVVQPPDAHLQAFLYPRALASPDGGAFVM